VRPEALRSKGLGGRVMFSSLFDNKGDDNSDQSEEHNDKDEKIVSRAVVAQELGVVITIHALVFIHLDQPTQKLGPGLFPFEDADDHHKIDHNRQRHKNEHDRRAVRAPRRSDAGVDGQSQKVEENGCDDEDRVCPGVLLEFFNDMLVDSLNHCSYLLSFAI
jgi:hypothetical protein